MRAIALLAALLLLPRPAAAQDSAALGLSYTTYVAGMTVMTAEADVELTPQGYRVDFASRTAGTYGVLFRGETRSLAQGAWAGALVAPARFAVAGEWRGKPRRTLIEYQSGVPTVLRLVPANEEEREPVPEALQRETVDAISAAALLVRQTSRTGRCEGATRTYDGRRLVEVSVTTGGWEVLPPDARSVFAGEALRCDFGGRLLAGFMLEGDRRAAARPQQGSAWLARLSPGGPLVPVRLRFDLRWLGSATMLLTGAVENAPPLVRVRADAENGAPPLRLPLPSAPDQP
jgi:hypothetical protein